MPDEAGKSLTISQKVTKFFSHPPMWYWDNVRLELAMICLFFAGVTKFFIGKAKNEKIAMTWRKNVIGVFKHEFEHLGCDSKTQSLALMQRSYYDYEYFASGRKNVYYVESQVGLKKRHCLFSSLTFDLLYGNTDKVTINIPLDLGGRKLPLEFFVCRRKDLKANMSAIQHLSDFVKNSNAKHYRLTDSEVKDKNALMIMAEHDEVTNQLIDEEMGSVFKKFAPFLVSLHVTD